VRAYRERARLARANRALAAAMQAYFEGRYARAEREAGEAHAGGVAPGLAALIAARAAHRMRESGRCERWLELAAAAGESAQAARLVSQAELALEDRDYARARDALRSLHGGGPKHVASLRLLLRAERGLQNWPEVARLAAQLAKRDAIAPAAADEYRIQATVALLNGAAGDRAALEARWRRVAPRDQVQPRIAAAGAGAASREGAATLAREILERALAEDWSEALLGLYAELPALEGEALAEEARRRIERAERWLPDHAGDGALLACLGRLCARAGLWGQAQRYLEASLSFRENRATRLELARVAERAGRRDDAARQFRIAAELP
jgi:HemY protein